MDRWPFTKSLAAIATLLGLSGCGFCLNTALSPITTQTISLPFVKGDAEGNLTATLVYELTHRSSFHYVESDGELVLLVEMISTSLDHISFRYDQKKKKGKRDVIIPDGSRLTEVAQVTLLERCSGKKLLGPVFIRATADFDHDYYSIRGGVNIFSLGQLNDIDVALPSAVYVANRELARKIVEFIIFSL